jgi:PD-(D/E)XK nuclease superfamily
MRRQPPGHSRSAKPATPPIDRVGDGALATYAIWDYKTGSDYSYDQADPFRQGRIIQPFLYASMVAHRLKSVTSPQAKVTHFGFFFPGIKPMGRRIKWTSEQLGKGQEILSHLVDSIIQGAFLATNDYEEDCKFCDYRPICGDVAAVSAASQRKLDATGNTMLDSFRALRPGEDS